MRELMAPEVELGVVTPAELNALAGTRSVMRGYTRSQPSPRTTERVLAAETDLAHQIARDGGADTEAVQQARAAVAGARGS
jgi:membrane-bound ClpP family serine protease